MTQAINQEQVILENIKELTPQQQHEVLEFIEFLQFKAQKQGTAKQKEEEKQISFLEADQEFIGCVDGGPGDLATNKNWRVVKLGDRE